MKRIAIGAAALLIGTSALAWAPSSEPVARDAKDPVVATTDAWAITAAKEAEAYKDGKTDAMAWSEPAPEAVLQPASLSTWDDQDLDLSEDPDAPGTDMTPDTSTDTLDEPAPVATDTGVGGPDETVETAAADLAPRTAAQNYPPCDPGPGDDNCIQLYEPGVRTALASWNQPTGGLLDHQATTAMGGPYEPVAGEEAAAGEAYAGDGTLDAAAGETQEVELALADTAQYSGVGGPTAETGYPPCSPGPGDDRCIQLYEPGVTGAGN